MQHGVEARRRNPVREVILHAYAFPSRSEWSEHLDTLKGLRKVWLDPYLMTSGHQKFVEWLQQCLPETEVMGSSF